MKGSAVRIRASALLQEVARPSRKAETRTIVALDGADDAINIRLSRDWGQEGGQYGER